MISEVYLRDVCGTATLNRARTLLARSSVRSRSVQYHSGLTMLYAQVASASVPGVTYSTYACLDERRGILEDFECSCPVGMNPYSPCKHVAALILDFNKYADYYAGYNASRYVSTTSCISDYLEKALTRPQAQAEEGEASQDDGGTGAISLELTLVYDGGWSARFRVMGPRGGYVLKNIEDLTQAVGRGEWRSYGKKLAFTHSMEAFTDQAQGVVRFLQRAVSARTAGGATFYRWSYITPHVGRDLHLSSLELSDLVDLYSQEGFLLDDGAHLGARPRRMRVVDGDPQVGVELVALDKGGYELKRSGQASFANCDGRLLAWQGDTFYRCTQALAGAADFLTTVYASPVGKLVVSKGDVARFAYAMLPTLEEALGTRAPAELDKLKPVPCKLEFYLDRDAQQVTCEPRAVYGERTFELLGPAAAEGRTGRAESLVRDEGAERRAMSVLGRYFPDVAAGGTLPDKHAVLDASEDDAVAALAFEGTAELARLGQVFTTPAFDRLVSARRPRFSVGLSVHSDLIDLSISSSDLPQDELFALLSSYRRKRRYHRLRDGSFVDMHGIDLAHVDDLAQELGLTAKQLAAGQVELPSYRAFLLDDMLADDEKDLTFEDYLAGFEAVDPEAYRVPPTLEGVLRPYQKTGFRWLSSLTDMGFGGILADEMGLGKSVQLISLLLARREEARGEGPSLIVCPASLVYNWGAEFARFAPELDVAVVSGTARERQSMREDTSHDVLITSYDLLRRDIEDYTAMSFWCEVLDEAQFIKNHTTLAARSVKRVAARHRFALTGTPVENRLSELWSIFDYLMPGLLGGYAHFRERYEQPILDGDEDCASRLRAAVRPFILRRLKADVLSDLPDKMESVVYAHMEGRQQELYAAQEQSLRLALTKQTDAAFSTGKLQVLAELTRLREICCDPRLLYEDYEGRSAKLDAIMELVGSAVDSQQQALVFSQFTSYLDLIEERLKKAGLAWYRIDGSTPKRRRLDLVDRFNEDGTPVFLISLKAGGTGLNLTGASVVIHADPWWNEAAQNQATDRAHRIGQTREVSVYKVIAKGTLEERILRLQQTKRELAASVMDAENASIASFSKDDLIDLLGD